MHLHRIEKKNRGNCSLFFVSSNRIQPKTHHDQLGESSGSQTAVTFKLKCFRGLESDYLRAEEAFRSPRTPARTVGNTASKCTALWRHKSIHAALFASLKQKWQPINVVRRKRQGQIAMTQMGDKKQTLRRALAGAKLRVKLRTVECVILGRAPEDAIGRASFTGRTSGKHQLHVEFFSPFCVFFFRGSSCVCVGNLEGGGRNRTWNLAAAICVIRDWWLPKGTKMRETKARANSSIRKTEREKRQLARQGLWIGLATWQTFRGNSRR